ncbi:hypothetical protein FSP39_001749 [Pinctada imbricata]|uniref:E3 ubiquitin-protein ligase rififylin n=1 Tax=Pinctada imbricata TaxID=66713 RepID=A0AA88XED5_PINIB|nr:hypothetical protein FSP39_001749 [Pinctada imbricata]
MGAGVVRAQQDTDGNINVFTAGGPQIVINSPRRPQSPEMLCEGCNSSFNILRRKKRCRECDRYFCGECIVNRPDHSLNNRGKKSCQKCLLLISGNFSRQDLQDWKVKDLRSLLKKRNISMETCTEKNDLIELLYATFAQTTGTGQTSSSTPVGQHREPSSISSQTSSSEGSYSGHPSTSQIPQPSSHVPPAPPPGTETEEQRAERLRQRQRAELAEAEARYRQQQMQENNREQAGAERKKRFAVTDIESEAHIESLTVKQLKEVLVNNFVDYKGCVEKAELKDRVLRLWKEHRNNQQKDPETVVPGAIPPSSREEDLCKICLDHVINCVLLECGHMVTCTTCGRQLADCPICRQTIVRVVHTFKS